MKTHARWWAVVMSLSLMPMVGARLRTVGKITRIGLLDDHPLHLAIILDGCEFEAMVSRNGGKSWHPESLATLPKSLGPLPTTGTIRYLRTTDGTLLRSDDGGQAWTYVAPWSAIWKAIRKNVEAEKQRFMARYGHWFPSGEGWLTVFALTLAALIGVNGWGCRRRGGPWISATLLALLGGFFVTVGLLLFHYYFNQWLGHNQWEIRMGHWDTGITFPLWPMGFLLQLTGNPWLAPVTAALCFPLVGAREWLGTPATAPSRGRVLAVVSLGLPASLALLMVLSPLPGIGRGWTYDLPEPDSTISNPASSEPALPAGDETFADHASE